MPWGGIGFDLFPIPGLVGRDVLPDVAADVTIDSFGKTFDGKLFPAGVSFLSDNDDEVDLSART